MFTKLQKKRLWNLIAALCVCLGITTISLVTWQDYLVFCYTPTELCKLLALKKITSSIRVGGKVVQDSMIWQNNVLFFQISDNQNVLKINYQGSLPGLFREGQEVLVEGKLNEDGTVKAVRVLAKHDEYYKPKNLRN